MSSASDPGTTPCCPAAPDRPHRQPRPSPLTTIRRGPRQDPIKDLLRSSQACRPYDTGRLECFPTSSRAWRAEVPPRRAHLANGATAPTGSRTRLRHTHGARREAPIVLLQDHRRGGRLSGLVVTARPLPFRHIVHVARARAALAAASPLPVLSGRCAGTAQERRAGGGAQRGAARSGDRVDLQEAPTSPSHRRSTTPRAQGARCTPVPGRVHELHSEPVPVLVLRAHLTRQLERLDTRYRRTAPIAASRSASSSDPSAWVGVKTTEWRNTAVREHGHGTDRHTSLSDSALQPGRPATAPHFGHAGAAGRDGRARQLKSATTPPSSRDSGAARPILERFGSSGCAG